MIKLKPKFFKCICCGKKVFYAIVDGKKLICELSHHEKVEESYNCGIIHLGQKAYDEIITHDCEVSEELEE